MLSRLKDLLRGTSRTSYPSAVLIVSAPTTTYTLHIVPEDGTVESGGYGHSSSTSPQFRFGSAIEQSREQLGTVALHVADGESPREFLDDISERATQLLAASQQPPSKKAQDTDPAATESIHTDEEAAHAVSQALRAAVADSLTTRTSQNQLSSSAQTYPIYLVHVHRPRPGKLITDAELTSLPR